MGKVVEIDCEKPMKLETSPKVTKSKRSLRWCRSISKKYLCTFYYSISQKVITLSGRRFITVSGVLLHYRAFFITLSGSYYGIGRLLHYRLVQQLYESGDMGYWKYVKEVWGRGQSDGEEGMCACVNETRWRGRSGTKWLGMRGERSKFLWQGCANGNGGVEWWPQRRELIESLR